MKKVLMALSVVLACAAASAQEVAPAAPAPAPDPANAVVTKAPPTKASWPVWLAFNSVKDIDVIGVRFTLPYGKCEGVTGFDLGVYGCCRYFEGVQINILRNEAKDIMAGCQLGIYNSAGRADMYGVQVGLFNEVRTLTGVQVGLINIADSICGVQVGLINRAETSYGFQVGGVNVIRESDLAFCPLVNIGFDMLTPAL